MNHVRSVPGILAVLYDDGLIADSFLSELGYGLRDRGYDIAGLVQLNTFRRDREKCDMVLEELASGEIFQLSEDRGKLAGGCRLDSEAIASAAVILSRSIARRCDLLIINKFGKTEAEGRGLRDVIAGAIVEEIPVVVGVPRRNLHAWQQFSGGQGELSELDRASMTEWVEGKLATLQKNQDVLAAT